MISFLCHEASLLHGHFFSFFIGTPSNLNSGSVQANKACFITVEGLLLETEDFPSTKQPVQMIQQKNADVKQKAR